MADELKIEASVQGDMDEELGRIERGADGAGDAIERMGRKAADAGVAGSKGADELSESLDDVTREAKSAERAIDGAGNAAVKSGTKAAASSSAWDRFEKRLAKTKKTFGGFSWLMKAFKWTAMVGGAFAAAGAVSALGAGAVIAVGGLAPLVLNVAALGVVGLAGAVGMKALKLGLEAAAPQADALKAKFDGLGNAVARGGLASGLDYMTDKVSAFARVTEMGFEWIGGSLGRATRMVADFSAESRTLEQSERIFGGFSRIIDLLAPGLVNVGRALLDIIDSAMPVAEQMAGMFSDIAESLARWTQVQADSGNMTRKLQSAWELLRRTGGVIVDLVVGLYRIFKIAAGEAGGFGTSIENAAAKFKAWTGSVEGQQKLADYFRQAVPAIRETALLIGDLLKMFGGLAANQDVAPLLAKLRTEFVPALGELLSKMSGAGGLLPVLIDAATAVVTLMASLDPAALRILVDAFAGVIEAISWLTTNVPGADTALSTLLTGFLLIGPVSAAAGAVTGFVDQIAGLSETASTLKGHFDTAAGAVSEWTGYKDQVVAFKDQLKGAADWTKGLVAEGKLLHGPWQRVSGPVTRFATLLKTQVVTAMGWVRTTAISMWASITWPIALAILAIIAVVAVIIYLWNNCEWFRDAVIGVWEWIKNAAIVAWEWIKSAVSSAITVIGAIVTWLYTNIIKPVVDVIVAIFTIGFNILMFIAQVALFIIGGLFLILLTIATEIWNGIAAAATWVWNSIILPVIQFVVGIIMAIFGALLAYYQWLFGIIGTVATWVFQNVILPVVQVVAGIVMAIWNVVVTFFTWLWGIISQQATSAWNIISAAAGVVGGFVRGVWQGVMSFLSPIFEKIKSIGVGVWDAISGAARAVGGAIKSVWDGVIGAIKGVYNSIANMWNGIPSINVLGFELSLPKLPTWWHGGHSVGVGLVGEHGPEPLVRNGKVVDMVGQRGPEVRDFGNSGGYIVPNLDTLSRFPGLRKTIPPDVAGAVARSVPGYASALGDAPDDTPQVRLPGRGGGDDALAGALNRVATALLERDAVNVSGGGPDVRREVLAALDERDRKRAARGVYKYGGRPR